MSAWRVRLSRSDIRRACLSLAATNVVLTVGTALFIHFWGHRDHYGPAGRMFIDRILVQFHLATENVVAAWYSSMLLLSVAAASGLAFVLDRRMARGPGDRTLAWGWVVIAATFVTLSLDEIGSFHERVGMLGHGAAAAMGWVYILLVPIAAVGLFMLAFAWVRLRAVPAAAALFVAGTALFLSDPLLELAEMSLLSGGVDRLFVHNVLLVIEEGLVELGGALGFLIGVLIYVRRVAGEGPHVFKFPSRLILAFAIATAVMTAAVPVAHWIVDRLPPGDTGIPEDWFPAAMLFVLWLYCAGSRRRGAGVAALALSACFGAGLYGYVGLADARLPITMLATAGAGLLTTALLYRAGQHPAPRTQCAQHSVH